MGVLALVQTFLPVSLRRWLDRGLEKLWDKLFHSADPHVLVEVEERAGPSRNVYNLFYRQSGVYLSSLRSAIDSHMRLKVFRSNEDSSITFSLPDKETLEDSFGGARVWWTHTCREKEGGGGGNHIMSGDEKRSFILKFLKPDRSIIIPGYLDHISKLASEIEHRNAHRHLYTNNFRGWEEIPFNHPSTFNTLALPTDLANRIKADLDAYANGEEFYHRNGRAWKRGYLLYGPPGTGKSSMIAAIANYLQFDIYDLELSKVLDNGELKSLLMQTARKSIIVIEDIDCTVQLPDRTDSSTNSAVENDAKLNPEANPALIHASSRLTLSGLLNFTDGLWSCCGEERIFIFTTNHKDRLDPALLRPGRMDMHILLSYCTFEAFKKLASSYLGIEDHELYAEVNNLMTHTPHQITPAAMAEILISNQSDADAALKHVMNALITLGKPSIIKSGVDQVANGNEKCNGGILQSGVIKRSKSRRKRCTLLILESMRSCKVQVD
ncbi:hypothetical protein GOP47_0011886 [Adiantum capillus-veneris]|uniref:AAA+ ATPase domain-containing protein n=1 Tax=Adiantum capillus-veneris TaxID=13818 RepID=A0A9D4UTL9_ADICA|nr:hypothetical protein GOP47_0011886 [Adiantum capillus-veneris]